VIGYLSVIKNKASNISFVKLAKAIELAVEKKGKVCCCCKLNLGEKVKIIYYDSNENNIEIDNLFPACAVCYSLHRGGISEDGERQGKMIVLHQDMSQVDLIRLWYVASYYRGFSSGSKKDKSQDILLSLSSLSNGVVKLCGTDNPQYFRDTLIGFTDTAYKKRDKALSRFGFLPYYELFKDDIRRYQLAGAFLSDELVDNLTNHGENK
jgi:hypothetical protein